MRKLIILCLLLASLLLPDINAERGHMKLLAVSETNDGYKGGIADLYLEVKPGSGRVFLETFPLTKLDTQISTRFAKEIACDFADIDCGKFDFFYTITADSPIVAGPSAGAAISVLTFSLIKDVDFDGNTVISGTINSGGLIGPVGGLKAKIEAAHEAGLKKVLIPPGEYIDGENFEENSSINESFDFSELSAEYGIEIKEVGTLDEAVFEFTGRRFREKKANLTISQDYKDTMKMLAIQLCSRSTNLRNKVSDFAGGNETGLVLVSAVNMSDKGKDSFNEGRYYSSASYCFGANVEFNYLSLLQLNLTEGGIKEKADELRQEIQNFDESIEGEEIKTITDLESYMIVKERLTEAHDFLDIILGNIDDKEESLHNLAYAVERLNSAKSWSTFFGKSGKEFVFNDEIIENACRTKLSEVEERLQYVQLYLIQDLEATRKEMDYAYNDLQQGDYELCLFKASKAKANVDSILSVFGVKSDNISSIISQKLGVVERNLVEETERGVFPILGYSYFEYANSLKDSDPFSALLYSEYALELGNLDIYFKDIPGGRLNLDLGIDNKMIIVLLIGIVIGIFVANITGFKKTKGKRIKSKRK
ncbi:hypothetical protein KY347_04980 [Candidatus Woesearchaeota archaeon]|nr:hypothetical protein [Candidatus Woesearchaeota archaeon]